MRKQKTYKLYALPVRGFNRRAPPCKDKPKLEFSKLWLIACMCATGVFCLLSYVLAFLERDTVQELSIAIMQTLCAVDGVSFVGYNVQNIARAWSMNKYMEKRTNNETEVED
jgi:hypothetical protein